MTMVDESELRICSEADIVEARKAVREVAKEFGFGVTDVTRVVTAASELARNIFRYAGDGVMRRRTVTVGDKSGLELVFEDKGPGIADIDKAMEPGYTTTGGLGMGLPGAKRLVDDITVWSEPGKGTTVVLRKWLRS